MSIFVYDPIQSNFNYYPAYSIECHKCVNNTHKDYYKSWKLRSSPNYHCHPSLPNYFACLFNLVKFKIMLTSIQWIKTKRVNLDFKKLDNKNYLYVVACHIRTVPSSEPVIIIGSSGWKQTADTLCVCPSSVWTQLLVW